MTIEVTNAARQLESSQEVSPHALISLLMAGTLERTAQAKISLDEGDEANKEILLGKIVAIIKGLRESLNFDQGGDIAVNLDSLYDYMLNRFDSAESKDQEKEVLVEVERLMTEVKSGWDGAAPSTPTKQNAAA